MFATQTNKKKKSSVEPQSKRAYGAVGEKNALERNPLWQSLALRPASIQPKLAVSQPDDPYEHEADAVADRVMRMATPPSGDTKPSFLPASGTDCCAYRSAAAPTVSSEGEHILPSVRQLTQSGGGRPLDDTTREYFETRFGRELPPVQIHTGAEAHAAAGGVSAHAFTFDNHIAFRDGLYAPETTEGRRLLAHELVHVVQQERGGMYSALAGADSVSADLASLPRSRADGPAECEAASAARVFASGGSPRVHLAAPIHVAREEAGTETAPVPGSSLQKVIEALDRPQEVAGVGDYPEAFRILSGLGMAELLSLLAGLGRQGKLDLLTANINAAAADRDHIEVGIAAVKLRASQQDPVPASRVSELGPAFGRLPQGDQDAVRALLAGRAIAPPPAPSPPPPPPPANLSTLGADAFESGMVSAKDVKTDPKWVENDIAGDQLSDQAPWTYTLTYKDGSKLVIPLEQVFMEPLPAATVTLFRKQKASGRIVPCVLSQSDPRLKALKGPTDPNFSAVADLATPRFDARTAPKIVSLVNAAQMLFLGKGILEVLQVQAMNPLMGGGMGAAGKAGGSAAKVAAGGAAKLGGAAAKESLTFVEIGAGDLKAAIELAKKGGVKVVAVDPLAPAATAVKELQGLGGQFVKGVAADVAPATADHVFQYFPWRIREAGSTMTGGTWRLVDETIRLLKPNGAAHFVTEHLETAEYLAQQASRRGLRAVVTETAAGAAAPGASGAQVPGFSKALKVWMVNIYK